MAFPSTSEPFRFLDLPREIRNQIYQIVLCSFAPRPTTITIPDDPELDFDFTDTLARVEHDTRTSILLTSRQIHREAYDTMVKTNRFVRLTSSGGIPLRGLFSHLQVPVVTSSHASAFFNGYVLSVSLVCPKHISNAQQHNSYNVDPCSLMLLGRDMDVLCDVLMDGDIYIPGFGMEISLKLTIAPGATLEPSPYKDTLTDFFSETTQTALLHPFRSRLRGFKKIKIRGLVDRPLAHAAEQDIAQDNAIDPAVVLAAAHNEKAAGQSLFKAGQPDEACLIWQDAALEIEQLVVSSSWPALVGKAGQPFAAQLAETYFLMKLNILHVQIGRVQTRQPYAEVLAADNMEMALRALKKGYWMEGYQWRPSDVHRAKFCYRQALLLRLMGKGRDVERAVESIECACRLVPGDAAIERGMGLVMEWRRRVRGE